MVAGQRMDPARRSVHRDFARVCWRAPQPSQPQRQRQLRRLHARGCAAYSFPLLLVRRRGDAARAFCAAALVVCATHVRAYRASRARIGHCIQLMSMALRQGGAAQPSSRLWRFQSSLLCAAQQ
jgi:hypothetical protein